MSEDNEWPIIQREHYFKLILAGIDEPFIKIITGIRRCGKSTLMNLLHKELSNSGIQESDIVHLNFDIDDRDLPQDHRSLTDYIESIINVGPKKYVLLDEIQNVKEWERTVSSLYAKGADVYITGSNSQMLSSELSTKLSGRCIELNIMPLIFSEYLKFRFKSLSSKENLFLDFIKNGGLPAVAISEDRGSKVLIPNIISETYQTVYSKDVIDRHKIRDPAVLRNLIKFIMRNIGDRTSSRKAANYLNSSGQKISHVTLESYIEHLEDAMLISRAKRIDSKTKDYLVTSDKLYATDLGIRNLIVPFRPEDIDGILENVVYNELRYRFEEVAVCDVNGMEIDFVVNYSSKPEYFQVCYSLNSQDVVEREIRPFRVIEDSYPKTVITYERYLLNDIDGVRVVPILDWLTENNDS